MWAGVISRLPADGFVYGGFRSSWHGMRHGLMGPHDAFDAPRADWLGRQTFGNGRPALAEQFTSHRVVTLAVKLYDIFVDQSFTLFFAHSPS